MHRASCWLTLSHSSSLTIIIFHHYNCKFKDQEWKGLEGLHLQWVMWLKCAGNRNSHFLEITNHDCTPLVMWGQCQLDLFVLVSPGLLRKLTCVPTRSSKMIYSSELLIEQLFPIGTPLQSLHPTQKPLPSTSLSLYRSFQLWVYIASSLCGCSFVYCWMLTLQSPLPSLCDPFLTVGTLASYFLLMPCCFIH